MSRPYPLATHHPGSAPRASRGSPRAYTPYGYLAQQGAPLTGFAGQARDPITGLYHLGNGHRSYNPSLMRFLNPDSLSPFSRGGINAYAYCGADPINRIDPHGQFWWTVVGALSSFATGFGAFVRTINKEVMRMQRDYAFSQGQEFDFTPTPLPNRIGNIAYAVTGLSGVAGNVLRGTTGGQADSSLISISTTFGLVNSGSNIVGGVTSNFNTAQQTWRAIGQPGVSVGGALLGTVAELSGYRLASEAVGYVEYRSRVPRARAFEWVQEGSRTLADRYGAWRNGGATTSVSIEMGDIRQR